MTTFSTERNDKAPLRLRGGNDDINDDENPIEIDMDIDPDNQAGTTNNPKRFKSHSPGLASHTTLSIETALNNVDTTLFNMRIYFADMTAATKFGKKWASGMEDFITEVLVNTKRIAIEAVEVIGVNKQINTELQKSKRQIDDLHVRIGELSIRNPGDNQSRVARDPGSLINKSYASCLDNMDGTPTGSAIKGRNNVRNDPFPSLTVTTQNRKDKKTNKNKNSSNKLSAATKKPVKPVFTIQNENNLAPDDIWKVVSAAVPRPKVDGFKKLATGHYIVTSSDVPTIEALRKINSGLVVTEANPRKPRVKLRNIPLSYSPEFIVDSPIAQNQSLENLQKTDIRPLFRCGPRNDITNDWVLEVSPFAHKAMVDKRIYLGMVSTFPKTYTVVPHCRRCLQAGSQNYRSRN